MGNPWIFVDAICKDKTDVFAESPELASDYSPYLTNRALSYHLDTIMFASEMNVLRDLPPRAQFTFLLRAIRPRTRRAKWGKKNGDTHLRAVMEHYGYSRQKAETAMRVMTEEQVEEIVKIQTHGEQ